MASETKFDYTWVLRQVKALYLQMELPDPTVIGTDMERSLMLALRAQFPRTNHLLCIWHINKNVVANCKRQFSKEEEYLATTYITHVQHFVRCFTNRVLHFDTTTTSRGEGGHAVIKRQLGTSTGGLKTVVDGISLYC